MANMARIQRAFTLLEVVVALIIYVLIAYGAAGLFVASKRYILHLNCRTTDAELAHYYLEPLQQQVRQDAPTNCLQTNSNGTCMGDGGNTSIQIDNIAYAIATSVFTIRGTTFQPSSIGDVTLFGMSVPLRKVKLVLNWAENP